MSESLDCSEKPMEEWWVGLRDVVFDSAWQLYLRFLGREPLDEEVILTCDSAFLAGWIANHYSD